MLRWLFLLLLLPLVLLTGCSKKRVISYEDHGYEAYGEADTRAYRAESGRAAKREAAPARPSAYAAAPAEAYDQLSALGYVDESTVLAQGGDADGASAPVPPPSADRMVFYSGWAQLRVARVEEGIDAARALAEGVEGRVETIGPDYVVLRVPVDRFGEVFEALLELGEVLDKQITADDVTDSYRAVSLRLETAKATRARLQELLARAESEEEKLELLRQIQRLTDDIDGMEAQARTLSQLASMSRITLSLVARDALAWQGPEDEAAELAWIRRLTPFHTEVDAASRKHRLAVPEGMVALDLRRRFVAESPDGARIWTHKLLNEPAGDAAFWLDAVEERLAGDFGTAIRGELGGYAALRLVDRSDEPYVWVIAARVEGRHLHLVQIYYPSAEHEARHVEAVSAVLSGGEA